MSGYPPNDSSYPHHPAPQAGQGQRNQGPQHVHTIPIQPYYIQEAQHQHPLQQQQQQQPQLTYDQNGQNGQTNGQAGPGYPTPPPPRSLVEDGVPAPKGQRLRKACDSCSARKVKCDEGDPCKPCKSLAIPCQRERPSKRRGPPNKHAEQIRAEEAKRLKMEESSGMGSYDSPTSPNNVAATLVSLSQETFSAEMICPLPTIELLVDDFFTYIHPLAPFPHKPSFLAALKEREDRTSRKFLALLASMVGVLVASFPRKPMVHLKVHRREHLFPTSVSLVERCHKVATEARGYGYLDGDLSIYDAATSYFLGLAAAYIHEWTRFRLYFGETLNITRVLGVHKKINPGLLNVGHMPQNFGGEGGGYVGTSEPIDYIKQQIATRIFYVIFVGVRSIQQMGATFGELFIPPSTPTDPYPDLPLEVDDEYIFQGHIEYQPAGTTSKLVAFNLGIKIYMSVSPLATLEMTYGIDEVFDWNRQKKVLEDCLESVKQVLNDIPQELRLKPSSQPGQFESTVDHLYYPPMAEYPSFRGNGMELGQWSQESETKRKVQFEIQQANIYASQLGTRSYLVEKYGNLKAVFNKKAKDDREQPNTSSGTVIRGGDRNALTNNYDEIEAKVANEREIIVQDLLQVLASISQVNMEPNGGSFVQPPSLMFFHNPLEYHTMPSYLPPSQINKIRQIASTLIDQPSDRKGPLAIKHEEYLGKFVEVLMRLERVSPTRKNGELDDSGDNEEEELRSWADLRDYQMKFAQAGGFQSMG